MSTHPSVGDIVTLQAIFTPFSGATDPSGVITIAWKKPNGSLTTKQYGLDFEVKRVQIPHRRGPAKFTYQIDVNCDMAGVWSYEWVAGIGDGQSVDGGTFNVSKQAIA